AGRGHVRTGDVPGNDLEVLVRLVAVVAEDHHAGPEGVAAFTDGDRAGLGQVVALSRGRPVFGCKIEGHASWRGGLGKLDLQLDGPGTACGTLLHALVLDGQAGRC